MPYEAAVRSPNFMRTPWVWSHGDGLGRCVDPSSAPEHERLYEEDYVEIEPLAKNITEVQWRQLDNNHRLNIHNRNYHQGEAPPTAGQPAEEAEEAEEVDRTRESPRQGHRQVKYRDVCVEYISDDEDARSYEESLRRVGGGEARCGGTPQGI